MKQVIQTPHAPAPIGPYSQAVKAGNYLFVSGQIALDPETGTLIIASIAEETRRVMENLKAVLQQAEMDLSNVVKTTIFLSDMNNFAQVNEIYGSYFVDNFPARETVEVSRLPKDVQVEISVVAFK